VIEPHPPVADPELLLERVQQLSEQVDELPDPRARELASELAAAVIAMYGDGLERIVAAIDESGQAAAPIMARLTEDGAVSSLLLIHDLYPVDLHERVLEALDTVRPYMESHGGNVELVSLDDGVARLALQGSCNGCSASRATLEQAIEQALAEHAPDLAGLEVTGVVDAIPAPGAPAPTPAPLGGCELPMAPPQTFELPMVQSSPAP
jgi:Fe-S cluster biogenesis protein NfuA